MTRTPSSRANRILVGGALVVGVTVGGAALASALVDGDADVELTGEQAAALEDRVAVDREEAAALATEQARGTVVSAALDRDDGREVWEVVVEDGDGRRTEVELDATSGELLDLDSEDDDVDDADDLTAEEAAVLEDEVGVSRAGAERIATEQVAGTVRVVRLDGEDGRVVWEVVVEGDDGVLTEVQLDAATGDVLELDRD